MFDEAGLPTEVVSAGGTGSYDIGGAHRRNHRDPGRLVRVDGHRLRASSVLPFEHALFVLGTIVSRPAPERCVADCGHKSCTKDHGHPSVRNIPGASVLALNDEHATIALPPECALTVGDRIQLLPSHIDPTMNLHDVVYALDGDKVIGVWPITARGYVGQGLRENVT